MCGESNVQHPGTDGQTGTLVPTCKTNTYRLNAAIEQNEGKNKNNGTSRFDSACLKTHTELCVEGMGLCFENETSCPFWKGTGGVLLEVVSLIKRLESDRQEAKEALQEERHKAQRLRRKQDTLSLWKQQQFPVVVQLEYEACTRDIAELRWHLKVKNHQMQQVRNFLKQAETQNHHLLQNIDFVKKQEPLVKDKLLLEDENTKQIASARTEAHEVLTELSQELRNSQQELENDELQVNKERAAITQTLKTLRTELQERITELQQLKSSWDVSCARMRETEEKVVFTEKQVDAKLQQIVMLERQETKLSSAVMELKAQLQSQERKLADKQADFTNFLKQLQATRHEGEANVCESEEIFSRKRQELQRLRDKNKEHDMESEDYNKKICQSKQALQQLQKDQKRILEKISQNEIQADQAKGELALQTARHTNTKARLENLERQTLEKEQSMRKDTEVLKMRLMSEMKLVAAIKGNIASLLTEYTMTEADCEREREQVEKEHQEAWSSLVKLETEMVTLREIHTTICKKIQDLKRTLSDVLTAHNALSDELDQRKRACLDRLHSATEAHKTVLVRREQVSRRTEELEQKCEEYRKESVAMEDTVRAMPQVLEELQNESDTMEYKHNLISTAMCSLQNEMAACRNRTSLSKAAHSSLLSQRQAVTQDLKANLRKALKENAALAQEYRELQKAVMVAKREAALTLSEKNRAEVSFHNNTQLSLLQRRMHKAMLKYFKHRSVYSQAELAGFQALSNQNKQKMKALQEDLSGAIQRVSGFLTDASRDAMADKPRRVDLGGLNRPMPTVQIAE
ncbi:coiled-coil domain-containing protein 178 isoform X2 [Tachysurus fulvidraco]|uniref:coiled-coil domain-containing protein 178 isoform X2 n=1 Tax=Tachysurus fulvidraco TaxID=1234273 RepID=UPI001FEDA9DC|nr:coiled-coil domain-containing protein 178 isoform X2 [Tachysurus fulvidraco]XP_047667063.1 coiled-coil domain-containing protein 178 isoform X2 [Tachysurus fulvidraco]